MPGATGREVVILDLYPGAGEIYLLKEGRKTYTYTFILTAREIVAKNISGTSLSGEPVAVMCDPTEVRSNLRF